MCVIHDQKFACGCWRKTDAEMTHCIIALQNSNSATHDPTPCPRHKCKPAIRASIWYCIEHARCKQFNGNYEDLRKNMSEQAAEHVLNHADYNFELKPPVQADAGNRTTSSPAVKSGSESLLEGHTHPANNYSAFKQPQEGLQVHDRSTASDQATTTFPHADRYYAKIPGNYKAFTQSRPPGAH